MLEATARTNECEELNRRTLHDVPEGQVALDGYRNNSVKCFERRESARSEEQADGGVRGEDDARRD